MCAIVSILYTLQFGQYQEKPARSKEPDTELHEAPVEVVPSSALSPVRMWGSVGQRPSIISGFVPSSPFFSEENKELGANYVRFAFCKADSTLEEASDKIAQLVEKQRASE